MTIIAQASLEEAGLSLPEVFFFHVRNRLNSWLGEEFINAVHPSELEENRLFSTDYSVAYFFDKENARIRASRSVRHPNDPFVKKTGRDLAKMRLEQVFFRGQKDYDPYFDLELGVEDILNMNGGEKFLEIFKPRSAEQIAQMVTELAIDMDNLAGSVIISSMETTFDEKSQKYGHRFSAVSHVAE